MAHEPQSIKVLTSLMKHAPHVPPDLYAYLLKTMTPPIKNGPSTLFTLGLCRGDATPEFIAAAEEANTDWDFQLPELEGFRTCRDVAQGRPANQALLEGLQRVRSRTGHARRDVFTYVYAARRTPQHELLEALCQVKDLEVLGHVLALDTHIGEPERAVTVLETIAEVLGDDPLPDEIGREHLLDVFSESPDLARPLLLSRSAGLLVALLRAAVLDKYVLRPAEATSMLRTLVPDAPGTPQDLGTRTIRKDILERIVRAAPYDEALRALNILRESGCSNDLRYELQHFTQNGDLSGALVDEFVGGEVFSPGAAQWLVDNLAENPLRWELLCSVTDNAANSPLEDIAVRTNAITA